MTTFVLKDLSLKWIFCYKESLMNRMIPVCEKDLVLLFPHRAYIFEFVSNKYPKHMLLEALMQYSYIISH